MSEIYQIPLRPVPTGRPRFSRPATHCPRCQCPLPIPRIYSPTQPYVEEFQKALSIMGAERWRRWAEEHPRMPLSVRAIFNLQRPPNTRFEYPTAKRHGDTDNHSKTILDALDFFVPDERVVELYGRKQWAAQPSVELTVGAYTGKLHEGSAE